MSEWGKDDITLQSLHDKPHKRKKIFFFLFFWFYKSKNKDEDPVISLAIADLVNLAMSDKEQHTTASLERIYGKHLGRESSKLGYY